MMLARTLRLLRVVNDYTAVELAKELGIPQSTLSLLETGKREPSLNQLDAYARLFGLKRAQIVDIAESLINSHGGTADKQTMARMFRHCLVSAESETRAET